MQIYKKSLTLHYDEAQQEAALTLMSTDLDGISDGLIRVHDIWASCIQFGICIYLLVDIVGQAAVLVLFPTGGMFLACGWQWHIYTNKGS